MAGKFLQDLLKESLESAISKGTAGNVYEDAINNAFKNIKRNTTAIMNGTPYNIIMNPRTYKGSIETTVNDFKMSELSFSLQSKDALSDVNIGATYNNWAANRGVKESINDQYKNMYDYMMNMDRIELTGKSLSDDELEHVMEVGRKARRNKTYQSNNYSGQGADRAINYINSDRRTSAPVNTSSTVSSASNTKPNTQKNMNEQMIEFAKQRQERWNKVKEKAEATYKKNRNTLVTGKNRNHQLETRENARLTQIDDFQKELDIVNSEISELKKQRLKANNKDDIENMAQQIEKLRQRQKGLHDNIRRSRLGGSDATLAPTLELMPPREGAPMFEGGAVPSAIANDAVFNQQQAEQTRKAFEQKLDETKEAIVNNANVEKPSTMVLKNGNSSYRPKVTMNGNNVDFDSIYNHSIPKRVNKNNAPQPETTVSERSTRRPLTAEEQAAVDKANAQWKADNEARYSEMEKQINNMYKADDEIYGSPEDILNPNYKSKFEPIEETTEKTIKSQKKTDANSTKIKNETIEKLNKTKQLYEDILTDWTSASGDFNRQINTRTVGPHNIYAEGKQYLDDIEDLKNNYNVDDYVDGSYTMEQEVFKYSEGKGINGEDVLKVEGDLVDAPNAYASDLNKTLEEAKQTMDPEEYQRYKNNFDVEDALVKTDTERVKLNRKKVVRNKAGLLDGIGKPGAIMTGLNILGAVGDYKDARRKGHGVISSAARAGVQFAVGEALGLWAIPVTVAKEVPGLVMKGAETLYKENRRMNSAANFQTFGDVQFQDTQQLATMRQSGMEMAKMAQYNLQQTLMGNEATYLHR